MSRTVKGMSRGMATTGSRRRPLSKVPVSRSRRGRGAVIPARTTETIAAMSATKLPGPEAPQKFGPLAARSAAAVRSDLSTQQMLAQEKVLAEISHELGNFFHKLYYWSDYLKEKPSRQSADSTATQMLERTIRNLEDFLKVSLDYFHPTQLSFTRMAVSELMDGLLFQVRTHLNGTPLTIAETAAWRGNDAELLVDPGHLSRAFEIAVGHLTKQVGAESTIAIGIERCVRRDCAGLEVEFHLRQPNQDSPLFRTAESGIEWAVAQKVVALHGGELSERMDGPEEKRLVIFLPLSV